MILLVNGPNLNLLGEREPEVYGSTTLDDVERMVAEVCAGYGLHVKALQSNHEGALIDFVQQHRREAKGLILNPGAFTHTSYALHDCLKSVSFPAVEVHISNVHAREPWRRTSLISPAVSGQIAGLGVDGYRLAAEWLCRQVVARASSTAGAAGAGTRRGEPGPGAGGARGDGRRAGPGTWPGGAAAADPAAAPPRSPATPPAPSQGPAPAAAAGEERPAQRSAASGAPPDQPPSGADAGRAAPPARGAPPFTAPGAATLPAERAAEHASEWPGATGQATDLDPVFIDRNARGDYEPL